MLSVTKRIRRFLCGRRGQSGAVLAEFAFTVPVLAMLLVGIAGLSNYLIQVELLNSSVEAGLLWVTDSGWQWRQANSYISAVKSAVVAAGDTTVTTGNVTVECFYGCPKTDSVVETGARCDDQNTPPSPPANCNGLVPAGTPVASAAPGAYVRITAKAPFINPVTSFSRLFVALPNQITLSATTRVR